jgi:hypothetical protein
VDFPTRNTSAHASLSGMKTAIILTALLLVPSAGIGIALGAGPDHGYEDIRTESSPAIELLPGAKSAVLAQCDPDERSVGGGFNVAGAHPGVVVQSSTGVSLSEHVSGWSVTFVNRTDEEQVVRARAVCESA